MKKAICILLMLLFIFPALAESTPAESSLLAPFSVTIPEEVALETGESSCTFIYGQARAVAVRIDRVPDENPAEAVLRLMLQFDPQAVIGEEFPTAEGFFGAQALTRDKYGAGVDALTVMILSRDGDLLILSAYDMAGSEMHVRGLLDTLLSGLTVEGVPVVHKIK